MLDPLSVAGLALAVVDELLKLGEKTAEVIADIRSFDEAAKDIYEQVRHQIWKMMALKRILFEQSKIYGGSSLIENFDEDAQDQIHVCLVELVNVLLGALKLLENLLGGSSTSLATPRKTSLNEKSPSYSNLLSPSPSSISTSSSSSSFRAISNRSPLQLMRWSLRTKKQAIEIINHFANLNTRLTEKIQFLSLASEVGVDIGHLEHLQKDPDSIRLGFSDDASLKIAAFDHDKRISQDFELDLSWERALEQSQPVEARFSKFEWSGKSMLQENCVYVLGSQSELDQQTRNRVNSLAKLLHQPKEQLFCILPCQGWRFLSTKKRIAYLFEIPPDLDPRPESLLKLLTQPSSQPSLGAKFNIALSLATSIAQLHLVRWVHESIRSENILFFPNAAPVPPIVPWTPPNNRGIPATTLTAQATSQNGAVDLKRPWIFGFEFSRPDAFFSAGFIDICPDRDVYRHPERQGQPLTTFKKLHDIYAFGVILLELGVWRPAITLERNHFAHAKDPYAIQTHLMRHAQKHLEKSMGAKYRDITLMCLTGDFGITEDTREDLKLQQAFRSQIVDVLRKIVEIV